MMLADVLIHSPAHPSFTTTTTTSASASVTASVASNSLQTLSAPRRSPCPSPLPFPSPRNRTRNIPITIVKGGGASTPSPKALGFLAAAARSQGRRRRPPLSPLRLAFNTPIKAISTSTPFPIVSARSVTPILSSSTTLTVKRRRLDTPESPDPKAIEGVPSAKRPHWDWEVNLDLDQDTTERDGGEAGESIGSLKGRNPSSEAAVRTKQVHSFRRGALGDRMMSSGFSTASIAPSRGAPRKGLPLLSLDTSCATSSTTNAITDEPTPQSHHSTSHSYAYAYGTDSGAGPSTSTQHQAPLTARPGSPSTISSSATYGPVMPLSPTSLPSTSTQSSPEPDARHSSASTSVSATTSASSSRNSSPPFTLPPSMSLKRGNHPKRLALSLTIPTNTSAPAPPPSAFHTSNLVGGLSTPPSEHDQEHDHDRDTDTPASDAASDATPYTPGPPKTPALAMSLGRATRGSASRRPNLLSLITQPPTSSSFSYSSSSEVPPTPGGFGNFNSSSPFALKSTAGRVANPYATMRHVRRRSNTAEDAPSLPAFEHQGTSSRSAYPRTGRCDSISEVEDNHGSASVFGHSRTHSTATTASTSYSDASSSTAYSTAPSTRPAIPYGDGPVELIPGVYLGAEESVYQWSTWANTSRARILNVAQEVDDPWMEQQVDRKGKGKLVEAVYPAEESVGRPEVEYRHLMWGHGEAGLAEVDDKVKLEQVIQARPQSIGAEREEREAWRFWEAIAWVEEGRRNGEAVLIHCQCGVSRSATLSIAYLMALAAAGVVPEHLGHLKGMQDTYDFVKRKSSWIGPNVSLVFQLVEFSRNLTTLITAHLAAHPDTRLDTSFPTANQVQQSEAEWARQRAEFDEACERDEATCAGSEYDDGVIRLDGDATGHGIGMGAERDLESPSPVTGLGKGFLAPLNIGIRKGMGMGRMSVSEMKREAEELDEAMRVRRLARV